jgi:methylenetetrahydrofolate reductase (NADPH)
MNALSNLGAVLSSGAFAVTGELGPPKSVDPDLVRRKAGLVRGFLDAVNVTDNQTAIVRVSSMAACRILLDEGVEPVLQMTCRDRNRIALQSDILGAAALGIKNILCLSGDHMILGNQPDARAVYDIDSIQLVRAAAKMRDQGKLLCGEELRNTKKSDLLPPRILIGAAANPFAPPLKFRVLRLAKKIAAGADFIQTQTIFDLPRFKEWFSRVVDAGLHEKVAILGGVMPVKSHKALVYMKENVAGMSIPDELIARMEQAAEPKEEGVRICVEIIQELRKIKGLRGVHISTVEWENTIPQIVELAGLHPRPAFASEAPPAPSPEEKKT